jgi:hypothetical protein
VFIAVLQYPADLGGGLGFENELGVTAVLAHPVTVEGFEVRAGIGGDTVDNRSRRAEDVFEMADMVLADLAVEVVLAGRVNGIRGKMVPLRNEYLSLI